MIILIYPVLAVTDCNLDTLLIQLRSQVTSKWYELGLAVGMESATLDKLSKYPSEQCMVEVLDRWIRSYDYKLTWREVSHVLKKIKFEKLAEKILDVYKCGMLLISLHRFFVFT